MVRYGLLLLGACLSLVSVFAQEKFSLTFGGDQDEHAMAVTPTATGDYVIHTLVYNPATLDLSSITPGVTTGTDVNALLVQSGGSICASLDVTGAPVNVFTRKIGDYVWIDGNENGFQDIFEDGYEGATVTLLMAGPDGLYCTPDDIIVDQTTTNSEGFYCFECVLPGEYSILSKLMIRCINSLQWMPVHLMIKIAMLM